MNASTTFLGALFSRFRGLRVYPVRALGEALEQRFVLSAPHLVSAVFDNSVCPNQLRFTFDQDVSASLTPADLTVENVTTDEQFTPWDTSSPTGANFSWDGTDDTLIVTFPQYDNQLGASDLGALSDGYYSAIFAAEDVTNAAGEQMSADAILGFRMLNGDANNDGTVDNQDAQIVIQNYGSAGTFSTGDFDYSGIVDGNDVNILDVEYGVTLTPPPAAPTDLSVSVMSAGQINISWLPVEGATDYRIERSTDGENFSSYAVVSASNDSSSSPDVFADTGVGDGTRYWYRVRALTADNDSAYTPKQAGTTPLPAPSNITVTQLDDAGTVQVGWTTNSVNQTGFLIGYSTDGVNYTPLETIDDPTASTATVSGLPTDGSRVVGVMSTNARVGGLYGYTYLGGGETIAPTHGPAELAIVGPAEPAKFDGQVPATFEVMELVASIEPLTVSIEQANGVTGGDFSLSGLTVELTPDDPVADITLTPDAMYVPFDESCTLTIPHSSDYNVSSAFTATANVLRPVVNIQVTGQTILSGDTEAVNFTTKDYQGNPLSGLQLTVTSTNGSFTAPGSVDSGAGSVQVTDNSDDPSASTFLQLTYGPAVGQPTPNNQPVQGGQAQLGNAVLTGLSISGGDVTQNGVNQPVSGPPRWATVAQEGVSATVTAQLSSAVTGKITPSAIQWTGASQSTDPTMAVASLGSPEEDLIICTINKRSFQLDLWIIWGHVYVISVQNATDPTNAPAFPPRI